MVTSVCKAMLLALCGLAVIVPAASAQDDPVFVDPESPSGKEYELPIDRAREQAAPQPQKPRSEGGNQPPPIFGEGVEPDSAAGGAGERREDSREAGSADSTKPAKRSRSERANAPRSERVNARAAAERTAQAAAPTGGSGVAAIVGVGAGVLLLGGLLGLLLRRRAAP